MWRGFGKSTLVAAAQRKPRAAAEFSFTGLKEGRPHCAGPRGNVQGAGVVQESATLCVNLWGVHTHLGLGFYGNCGVQRDRGGLMWVSSLWRDTSFCLAVQWLGKLYYLQSRWMLPGLPFGQSRHEGIVSEVGASRTSVRSTPIFLNALL